MSGEPKSHLRHLNLLHYWPWPEWHFQRKLRTANGYSDCRPKTSGPLLPDRAARAISHRASAKHVAPMRDRGTVILDVDAHRDEPTRRVRSYWVLYERRTARVASSDHNL